MIATLTGKMTELGERWAVIEAGGVGYKVHMTDDAIHALRPGSDIKLWTHMAVREDAQDLYGFPSRKERDFFELLISISGIGPKSALNILSLVSVQTLTDSIQAGSVAHLVKISGLGKKTAEKIVLELKGRLGSLAAESAEAFSAGVASDLDAIEALKSLGYSAEEARDAIRNAASGEDGKALDTGAKVKAALKSLGK